MKNQLLIICVILSLIASSCATLFNAKTKDVSFNTNPVAADVYVNGNRMGTTPVSIELKNGKDYIIEFRKDGYKSVSRQINSKVGAGWIVLDVLGGLVPVIIDAATGSWKSLDQTNINATLDAEENP